MTLSVIVAAYNVENYLEQCLNSILEQQVSNNVRIIIVNDESTDKTSDICYSFAKNQSNIICIDQLHAGLGAARNTGLKAVDTEYVTFLDGDDWYQSHFCSTVLKKLEQLNECDILLTLPVIWNTRQGREEDWYDKAFLLQFAAETHKYSNVRERPELLGLQTSCCNRVFRTAFLRKDGFRFPEGVHWEDVYPHFHLIYKAEKIGCLADTGFCYRQGRPGQITGSKDSRSADLANVFGLVMKEASDWPDRELRYVFSRLFDMTRWRCRDSEPIQRQELLRDLKKMYDSFPQYQVRRYLSDREITPTLSHRMMNRLIRKGSMLAAGAYRIRDNLCSKQKNA